MLTIHCTHPDGETSEARYALTMTDAMELYAPDWQDVPHCVWATVADFLCGPYSPWGPDESFHV